MTKIQIKKLSNEVLTPKYETPGSSGMDIAAYTEQDITINPGDKSIIPTGFSLSIPQGYEVQIRPRSGLAAKKSITVLNTPGTIDSDYRGEIKVILINLSKDKFIVKKGERIGLIGESGTGKSTLFHIMLGLLNPSGGDVFYQNESIFKNLTTWRNEIGYISQNIYLLDSTIERNIAFNFQDEPVDREKLNKAINIANLEEKILSLPKGFKTLVGNDGHRLSGGERQRIAIARAAYKNPNIFFMDESTSALDSKTESIIMNNLNKTLKDKTFVIIAHRKTTIDKCDKIWQLKNGKLTT